MFKFLASLSILVASVSSPATNVTPADLAALERLECFKENTLISSRDDLVVLAIVAKDFDFVSAHGAGPVYAFGSTFTGQLVASDLAPPSDPDDVGIGWAVPSPPPVLRLELATPQPKGRAERKRAFTRGLDELRRLLPGVRLACVYDLSRWAEARLCLDQLKH